MQRSILVVLLAFMSPVGFASAAMKVVVTLPDLGTVAQVVGGDRIEVTVLCPGAMDPHFLPAKPSLARKLSQADALVYNGLELEVGWLPQLVGKARNPSVRPGAPGEIDCSAALTTILDVPQGELDRSMGDIHPQGNPHYTLDPSRMVEVAAYLADRFTDLDPEGGAQYQAGAAAFAAQVAARIPVWQERSAMAGKHPILLYHRNWNYLAKWLGLVVVGEIENRPGIAPSPRHTQQLIDQGRHLSGVIVIAAHWDHGDVAEEVAERMGATLVTLPGQTGGTDDAHDWFALLDSITDRLAAAVGNEGSGP